MKYPKGFRYHSDFHLYCQVVDAAEKLIQNGDLTVLFGFETDVVFKKIISKEDFANYKFPVSYDDFISILNREVLYLINGILIKNETEGTSLRRFLEQQGMTEDANEIIDQFVQKIKYTDKHLLTEEDKKRFNFKFLTTSKKVSEFDWDICKYVFPDDEEQKYVQLKLAVMDMLPSIEGEYDDNDNPCDIQFVCDLHDVDYLIQQLMLIRSRLEEGIK